MPASKKRFNPMRNIAVIMSLVTLSFTIAACNKGCKKEHKPLETTPKEENIKEPQDLNGGKKSTDKEQLMNQFNIEPGKKLYAKFDTSLGEIKAELFWEKAPVTVRNFVELAQGKKEWIDPNTGEKTNRALYDGTIFHRVIKDFMIQGGDPAGNGMGGPGYRFKDEFDPSLRHDKKGILSMANAGPNTNGSQFFITDAPTPHLDNRHSVFGQVIDSDSINVISKIASVSTGPNDRPKEEVKLNKVVIST
jgi:peptidyl-prolyl cis-trans isomerase A (cyclophilin A)